MSKRLIIKRLIIKRLKAAKSRQKTAKTNSRTAAKLAARSIVACRRLQHFLAEKRPTGPTIERVTIGLLQRTMRRVSVTRAGFGISNANLTPFFIKKLISCDNANDYQRLFAVVKCT